MKSLSTLWGLQEVCKPDNMLSPESESASILILDFTTSKTEK